MTTKVFVLLSGGLDSTVLATLACDKYGPALVTAVSIEYGQRHSKELDAAIEVTQVLRIEHLLKRIPTIGKGGLTDKDQVIPQTSYDKLQGVSPSYVPFRNGLLLSTLTSIASAKEVLEGGYDEILVGYGAHAEDAQGWAYPDCTPEFIGAMANAIYVGTYHKVRLWAPFMLMTKAEVVDRGARLNAPMGISWSCYEGGIVHCGKCPTCIARKIAFEDGAGYDPTTYATDTQEARDYADDIPF